VTSPTNLLSLDLPGLITFCEQLGEKPYRAQQLCKWIHQRGEADFPHMTNLAKSLRDALPQSAQIRVPLPLREQESDDGVIKWLFDAGGGNAIESVYIPEQHRGTLCLSSQVGCVVGCRFCSTGHQGFSRNLESAEIIGQLWYAEHALRRRFGVDKRVISNVVMMGMGEPLQNYQALLPALSLMLDQHGYGLSRRRVTVSTSGVVPMIERLGKDCPVALAVSLHAANDSLRDQLVPLNRTWPLEALMQACVGYLDHAPRDTITFEYCMLDGVNDSPVQARELILLLGRYAKQGLKGKLNLIPFNPFSASGLRRSSDTKVMAFARQLQQAGIVTTTRKPRGQGIDAACGQLAGEVQDRTKVAQRMRQRREQCELDANQVITLQ